MRQVPERNAATAVSDDLADVAALADEAVGVGAALERERLGDDRPERALRRPTPRSGSMYSSSEPLASQSVSMLRPITGLRVGISGTG